MKGYKIEFEIYAESEQEAQEGRKAIVSFISELAYNGKPVTGQKIAFALKKWRENMFLRHRVMEYFTNNKTK